MNNADKEFILRIQDKGNRFIFVDKKTDKKKANKYLKKTNFKRIHFDPTSSHIQKVKQFFKEKRKKRRVIKRIGIFHI